MSDRFTIDTNVLIYSIHRDSVHHATAAALVGRSISTACCLGTQALCEFFWAATRKNIMPPADARELVRDWATIFDLFSPEPSDIDPAMEATIHGTMSFWDSHLMSAARRAGCAVIFSEDMQDGALLNNVRVINPFDPQNAPMVDGILEGAKVS